MTAATYRPYVPSANELFKQRYTVYLRWAAVVALILLAVVWWTLPRYHPQPYRLRQEVVELIEIEPLVELNEPLEEPPPLPLPRVVEPVPEDAPETENWESILLPVDPTRTFRPREYPTGVQENFVAVERKPQLLSQPRPEYPEFARMAGLEGTVLVKIFVGTEGGVLDAQILQSVHPLLDGAALAAARRCRFDPGRQREVRVATWVAVPYRFKLH